MKVGLSYRCAHVFGAYRVGTLNDVIPGHPAGILTPTRQKVAVRGAPRPTEAEREVGRPRFLDQLLAVLKANEVRGTASDPEIERTAADHGGAARPSCYRSGVRGTRPFPGHSTTSPRPPS